MNNELTVIVNESFGLQASEGDLVRLLTEKINDLILNNFNRLIQILYRADISEKKLNAVLAENKKEDAGRLIALLFIERHLQKIRSRQEHRRDHNDISEEERW